MNASPNHYRATAWLDCITLQVTQPGTKSKPGIFTNLLICARAHVNAHARALNIAVSRYFLNTLDLLKNNVHKSMKYRNVLNIRWHVRSTMRTQPFCKVDFTKIRKFAFFLITIMFYSHFFCNFAPYFKKRDTIKLLSSHIAVAGL